VSFVQEKLEARGGYEAKPASFLTQLLEKERNDSVRREQGKSVIVDSRNRRKFVCDLVNSQKTKVT